MTEHLYVCKEQCFLSNKDAIAVKKKRIRLWNIGDRLKTSKEFDSPYFDLVTKEGVLSNRQQKIKGIIRIFNKAALNIDGINLLLNELKQRKSWRDFPYIRQWEIEKIMQEGV